MTTNRLNDTSDSAEVVQLAEQGGEVLTHAREVARRIVGRVRQALDAAEPTDPNIRLDGTDPDARPLPPG